jgi:hypothetical protein
MKPASNLLFCVWLLAHASVGWSTDACSNRAIVTAADVTVSDGSTFRTETFFQSRDSAATKHRYDDERIVAVEGPLGWMQSGSGASLGTSFHKNFALGHQFIAFLLHFEEIVSNTRHTDEIQFRGNFHQATSGDFPYGGVAHLINRGDQGQPIGLLFEFPDTAAISVTFLDWRKIDDVMLPFRVEVDDGERTFNYHFTNIDITEKSPLWFFEAITAPDLDELQIYRLHRKLLVAHCLGDAGLMSDLSASTITLASRGELLQVSNDAMRRQFAALFEEMDYTEYHDLALPIIETSPGSNHGWIWANVRALGSGRMNADFFDDRWAWVMLVEKVDGRWLHVGNASNIAR